MTLCAHSPLVAKSERYTGKGGQLVEDSEDGYFLQFTQKRKFAILRIGSSNAASSSYYVKYLNIFGEQGGFDYILDILSNKVQVSLEFTGQLIKVIQNASENFLEGFIKDHGEQVLSAILLYGLDSAEKNIRNLSQANLLTIIESIQSLAQRVHSAPKARQIFNNFCV